MKTRAWKIENGDQRTRSVLECGDLSPLSAGDSSPSNAPTPGDKSRGLESCDQSQRFKTWRLRLALFCLLPSALCLCAQAQHSIDWFTIDGGGTSTGGAYSVTVTIDRPDAGQTSGGQFTHLLSGLENPVRRA